MFLFVVWCTPFSSVLTSVSRKQELEALDDLSTEVELADEDQPILYVYINKLHLCI